VRELVREVSGSLDAPNWNSLPEAPRSNLGAMADTGSPVTVRPLRTGDFEQWQELWAAYLAFYRQELSDDITSMAFGRLSSGAHDMIGLVAVDSEDLPVGFAHLVFHARTWRASDKCYLEDLYVDPARRGGETARALFDALFLAARERGCELVYWHTQQYNGAARSLYDRVGVLSSMVLYEHLIEGDSAQA
jgi:GNAT superfamily N-acetyltransferase